MIDPLFAPAGPVFSINGAVVPSMARDCVRIEIDEGVEGLRTLRLDLFGTGAGATGTTRPHDLPRRRRHRLR